MTPLEAFVVAHWQWPAGAILAEIAARYPAAGDAAIVAAFQSAAAALWRGAEFLDRLKRSACFTDWPEAGSVGEELQRARSRGDDGAAAVLLAFPRAAHAGPLRP